MSIDFLRSTTEVTTDRQADGDTTTSVKHLARFGIEPGTVMDMRREYGKHTFRPSWLEVTWRDGLLDKVRVTGPRVIKAGLSDKEHGEFKWGLRYGRDPDTLQPYPFDRDRLPGPLVAAIESYELAVATLTGESR